MSESDAAAYLGLGTNVGDRAANLRDALDALEDLGRIETVSSVYATDPVGFLEQPEFWNLTLRLRTSLEPDALLDGLIAVERRLGRTRTFRNAPRKIDIDLLLYDDRCIRTNRLTVPHPRMLERGFVLVPLAEIAPDLAHPDTATSIARHRDERGTAGVRRLFSVDRMRDGTNE